MPFKRIWWGIVLVLLLHFGLRAHNIAVQDIYIDEGFHTSRAARVWDFEEHPARFAHGKLLLYYWLGIFEAEPPNFLYTSRWSMALFSLITCATLYTLGRLLVDYRAGLLAITLYAIWPYTLFYERMAMADPLAAGFVTLLVWRSIVFARQPTPRQGLIVGGLIGLATLSKLTVGLAPVIPVVVALGLWRWTPAPHPQLYAWFKRYIPPLGLAAGVVILMWLPIMAPVIWSEWQNNDEIYVVVNDFNVNETGNSNPRGYIQRLLPLIADFTSEGLWIGLGMATLGLGLWHIRRARWRFALGLPLVWAALLGTLPILGAELVTARYFMPLMVPAVLLLAMVLVGWWDVLAGQRQPLRLVLVGALAIWGFGFVWSFNQTLLTSPENLPFEDVNRIEYQNGILIAEDSIRQSAAFVNGMAPHTRPVYATWNVCHLMFLYLERPVTCLDLDTPYGDYSARLPRELPPDGTGYIIFSDYQQRFFQWLNGVETSSVVVYSRESSFPRDVEIWALRWRNTSTP